MKNEYEPCISCKGLGYLNHNDKTEIPDICPECYGRGKLDWVETILGAKKPFGYDSLHMGGNSRAQLDYIRQNIEHLIESYVFEINDSVTARNMYYRIESFLNMCKMKRQVYNWQINLLTSDLLLMHPDKDSDLILNKIDINIKLNKAIQTINFQIMVK